MCQISKSLFHIPFIVKFPYHRTWSFFVLTIKIGQFTMLKKYKFVCTYTNEVELFQEILFVSRKSNLITWITERNKYFITHIKQMINQARSLKFNDLLKSQESSTKREMLGFEQFFITPSYVCAPILNSLLLYCLSIQIIYLN